MAEEFQVNQRSDAVEDMACNWPMIDALMGGTRAMRAAGEAFLPKWPNEDQKSYKARLDTATLFPAFERTVSVMAAKPFVRPVNFKKELPAEIDALTKDVDRMRTDFQAFAYRQMRHCLSHGLSGVLVDYPTTEGVVTVADEKKVGARPYFAFYDSNCFLGWRIKSAPEGLRLSQLRLMECVTEEDGPWGEKQVEQVRVLYVGRWEIWRKQDDQKTGAVKWLLHEEGVTSLDRIPFVFFYGCKTGFGTARPPLEHLAYLNVEHWQSASDQQTILHVARVPILFAQGFTDAEELTVGAGSAVRSLSPDAELKYVEHSGAAIEAGRQSLADLENRMLMAGAELLVQRPVMTATQSSGEKEAPRSILQQIVEDFEDSLEDCVRLMALWRGIDFEPEIELFKDFGAADLADTIPGFVLQAEAAGIISKKTAFEQLQRLDVIDPALMWNDELTILDELRQKFLGAKVEEATAMAKVQQPGAPGPKPPTKR